jgi:hypothetical protein
LQRLNLAIITAKQCLLDLQAQTAAMEQIAETVIAADIALIAEIAVTAAEIVQAEINSRNLKQNGEI